MEGFEGNSLLIYLLNLTGMPFQLFSRMENKYQIHDFYQKGGSDNFDDHEFREVTREDMNKQNL